MEKALSPIIENITREWDWDLAGGAWPVTSKVLEELARSSERLAGTVETGARHQSTVRRTPLKGYEWRRVYDENGSIDYDLVKKT